MENGQGALVLTGVSRLQALDGRARVEISEPATRGVTRHAAELARIAQGSEVVSSDLETVGRVGQLIFDEGGVLTGVVVCAELRLGSGRELPCAVLGWLDDGVIYLSVRTEELFDRPGTSGPA